MNLYLIAGFFFILLIIYICKCQSSIEGLDNDNYQKYEKCFINAGVLDDPDAYKDIKDANVRELYNLHQRLQNQIICINTLMDDEYMMKYKSSPI